MSPGKGGGNVANGKVSVRDRVTEIRKVCLGDLQPHPRNWRMHPAHQRAALEGVLDEIGWAGVVLAYETPNGLVTLDGHLRAETSPDLEVNVAILDVTEDEAQKLLATFDPIGAMAQPDNDKLIALLGDVQFQDKGVSDLLEALANGESVPMPSFQPTDDEPPRLDQKTPIVCPECGHAFTT